MTKSNNYDEEFRRDAVELLNSSRRPLKQVARELGICPNTLRNWRNRLLGQNGGNDSKAKGDAVIAGMSAEQLRDENQRLRRENDYLKRQRDILKKAALILGEDPR
jgi:transposase